MDLAFWGVYGAEFKGECPVMQAGKSGSNVCSQLRGSIPQSITKVLFEAHGIVTSDDREDGKRIRNLIISLQLESD